jgi:hypothetical protein
MKAGDPAQCSTRRRRRLPISLAQVPTVYPLATPWRTEPKGGAFRAFLKRLRDRMPRFVFVPGNRNRMWRYGETNPATGLPMYGGVDSAGNPYGTDLRISQRPPPTHQSVPATPLVPFHDPLSFDSMANERHITMESIDCRWGSADSL